MLNIDEIKPRVAKLAEKYGLSLVILFGSQATHRTHKESDIDLAYFSKVPIDIHGESCLVVDLMDIFKTDKVDIVSLRNSPPLLLKNIFEDGVVIYKNKNIGTLFEEFKISAIRKYFESKRLFDLRSNYVSNKIKEYQKELQYV